MGRAAATIIILAVTAGGIGCASRPTQRGDALVIPVIDAVEEDVGDPELQIEVPARDLDDRRRKR